ELQGQLTTAQSLLWLLRRQEAAAQRARHAREIERLGLELEAETARLRETERELEALRARPYQASDGGHGAQGASYEANAETVRLEQEIAHCGENRQRVERELAELRVQLARDEEQRASAQAGLGQWREEHARATDESTRCEDAVAAEAGK